jgi:hypothetical protein|tara:strand:- start:260 stop:496 length:237 start_codon:yes stop_codon:yes gene_type:complete
MNIKQFYLNNYPTDALGIKISENANFTGLLNELFIGNSIYEYIGVGDSLIRERLFTELSEILNCSYEYIYNLWLYEVL